MTADIALEAFERRHWHVAFSQLQAADKGDGLSAADLTRFGLVAQLLGNGADGDRLWERAYRAYLDQGDTLAAARSAFWLAMGHMDRGETAQGGGWLARAARLIAETGVDCAEAGYILIPEGLQRLEQGRPADALETFRTVEAAGQRFDDIDLTTLGRLGTGQSLSRLGRRAEGAALLDESMVSVIAAEVSPLVSGIVYCAVIDACFEMFDLRRASEWTDALNRWCDAQPDLVPFKGRCQVYRSEILQVHGDWQQAVKAADEAKRSLAGPPPHPAVGTAFYQQGELLRLRGAFDAAEQAYRKAEQSGKKPEPGRALLRLGQGRVEASINAIQHALDEANEAHARIELLIAAVEIQCASEGGETARRNLAELKLLAGDAASPFLRAYVDSAEGSVALGEGETRAAITSLRSALDGWQQAGVVYEAARTRFRLAEALRIEGDLDGAEREVGLARETFARLGAVADRYLISEANEAPPQLSDVLTAREIEILRLIATGITNRAIASNLVISERTVANHVSNILAKLELSSRAAATAWAYEHGLI